MKLYFDDKLASRKLICRCIWRRHKSGRERGMVQKKLRKRARQSAKRNIQKEILSIQIEKDQGAKEFQEKMFDVIDNIDRLVWTQLNQLDEADYDWRDDEDDYQCGCSDCIGIEDFSSSSTDNYAEETWMGYSSVDSPESDVPFERVNPNNIRHHNSKIQEEEFPLFV